MFGLITSACTRGEFSINSLSPSSRKTVEAAVNLWGVGMQHIADWLHKLGLSEYAQRFVENDIDVSVLPHLTEQDLKDLGVSLGHRRKILAAVAAGLPSLQP